MVAACGGMRPLQPGNPCEAFRDRRHAVQGVVAPGQERGASRRAERHRVPLRVGQAVLRQSSQRRHVDPAAIRRPGRDSGVVVENEQDVRCALGRLLRRERPPVRNRVADVELDGALEVLVRPDRLGSGAALLCAAGGRHEHRRQQPDSKQLENATPRFPYCVVHLHLLPIRQSQTRRMRFRSIRRALARPADFPPGLASDSTCSLDINRGNY